MKDSAKLKPEIRSALARKTLQEIQQDSNKQEALLDFINTEIFRVSDTGASYRQINYLEQSGLLVGGRVDGSQGWRIFSFREGVYIDILTNLRRFGLKTRQLQSIKDSFYDKPQIINEAIMACLLGIEVILILDSEGDGYIFDTDTLSEWTQDPLRSALRGCIELHLIINPLVNRVFKLVGRTPQKSRLPIRFFATRALLDNARLTNLERQLLEIIRDESYRTVSFSRKGGGEILIDTVRNIPATMAPHAISQMIDALNYGTVTVTKQDGRIVHLKEQKKTKL